VVGITLGTVCED